MQIFLHEIYKIIQNFFLKIIYSTFKVLSEVARSTSKTMHINTVKSPFQMEKEALSSIFISFYCIYRQTLSKI